MNHDPDRSSSTVSDAGLENRLLSTAGSQAQPPRSLPCVVQLGFVGARHLFDTSKLSAEEVEKLHAEALHLLRQTCITLRDDLKLEPHQFVTAISQLAIGADMLVARVCQSFGQPIPHRVFLPQPTAAFLDASNASGTPDFLPAEKAIVLNLLKSPSIIQERVVSRSDSRSDRFREANSEILRVSDVVVCLLPTHTANQPGGTAEFLERAKRSHKPTLEIRVGVVDGRVVFEKRWHNLDRFDPPAIPAELAGLAHHIAAFPLPSAQAYCEPLRQMGRKQAKSRKRVFRYAAAIILSTHVIATICATLAVIGHANGDPYHHWVVGSLLVELLLLALGGGVHMYLHHSHAAREWAIARLVVELTRPLEILVDRHFYMEYFFRLPLPYRFRGLLRTICVLHLRSTRGQAARSWQAQRDEYLKKRIDVQQTFFRERQEQDTSLRNWCHRVFGWLTSLAFVVTLIKLATMILLPHPPHLLVDALGILAIVLPVVAVSGLSWAAAFDCEARIETFAETADFLRRQRPVLEMADTEAEFERLLVETEMVLLGEIANWYSRRANTHIT